MGGRGLSAVVDGTATVRPVSRTATASTEAVNAIATENGNSSTDQGGEDNTSGVPAAECDRWNRIDVGYALINLGND